MRIEQRLLAYEVQDVIRVGGKIANTRRDFTPAQRRRIIKRERKLHHGKTLTFMKSV